MSRLAERIRNTEPWCVAFLHGPSLLLEKPRKMPPVPFFPLWDPGYVIKFQLSANKVVDLNGSTRDERIDIEAIIAVRRIGEDFRLEMYCNAQSLLVVFLSEGERFVNSETRYMPGADLAASGVSEDQFATLMKNVFAPFQQFLTNLHSLIACKNVHMEERQNSSKKRSKGQDRRQLESYWVLDIPGSPRYWERSPSDGLSGIQHRLHVVRGHFNTYTSDRPHVSGWIGPMWISSHARGNADLGFADKDYNLTEATK